MLRNWSVLICIVLLQLGNVHNAELSGVKGKRTLPRTQGSGSTVPTLTFEQKRRGSDSWGPVLGGIRPTVVKRNGLVYAKLEFKADSKLHNGTVFRCLVKENPIDPEPVEFDPIEVLGIDHSTLNPSSMKYINPTTLSPSYWVAPEQTTTDRTTTDQTRTDRPTTDRSTTDRPTTDKTATDQTTADRTTTDRAPSDRNTTDRTNVILYITSGVTGCILIIIIAEIIMRRCNRPSGEGHVDTPTPQQQVDETTCDMLSIYEELDDDSDSDNVSNPVRNIETGLLHNIPIHKDIEAGADTTAYMDMEAAKGIDTTPYMDMEAVKGIDTTPYMNMEAAKGIDTTPYIDMEAEKKE